MKTFDYFQGDPPSEGPTKRGQTQEASAIDDFDGAVFA